MVSRCGAITLCVLANQTKLRAGAFQRRTKEPAPGYFTAH
jgi:hypothetical protein